MTTSLDLTKLNAHIDKVKEAVTMADDLEADTEPYKRYLGGLTKACELISGVMEKDRAKQEEALRSIG